MNLLSATYVLYQVPMQSMAKMTSKHGAKGTIIGQFRLLHLWHSFAIRRTLEVQRQIAGNAKATFCSSTAIDGSANSVQNKSETYEQLLRGSKVASQDLQLTHESVPVSSLEFTGHERKQSWFATKCTARLQRSKLAYSGDFCEKSCFNVFHAKMTRETRA